MDDRASPSAADLPELLRSARALLDRYQRAQADEALAQALAVSTGAPRRLQHDLHLLACEAAFVRNDYPRAQRHAELALELAQVLGERTLELQALGWVGAALTQQSRYAEALERLHAAIDGLRALGQEPLACRALNYLAVVHEELGDPDKAIEAYQRSAAMARLAGDSDMLGRALSNLGEAWVSMRRLDRAEPALREALAVVEPRGDQVHLSWCLLALARLRLDAGKQDEAQALLERALGPAEQSGAGRTLGEALSALGALKVRRGEGEAGMALLQRALELFEGLRIQREVFRTHLALADAHEQLGDFAAALRHHRLYARIRAEVHDEVARAQLAGQAARHEVEKARALQEIERLRNVELAEANARLVHQARELQELSRRDPLTGLVNRRTLDERLAAEFERARRYGSPLSVAMADVDRFKEINDAFSHQSGDEVLRRVADLFLTHLRKTDLVARYGGDEIAVVFPETGLEQARVACEKVRAAVEAAGWEAVGPGLKVTVSCGLAGGADYAGWERLLSAADGRLYEAKRRGRNQLVG